MQTTHESHRDIKKNKLCPFKVLSVRKTGIGICNWHTNPEIILITDGSGTVQYGGETLKIKKGDTVIVNSGALHCFFSDGTMDFIGIIIDDDFCKENGISPESLDFERIVNDSRAEELVRLCAAIIGQYQDKREPILAAKARAQILELLVFLAEGHSKKALENAQAKNQSEEYVKRIIGHLIDNYTDSVTLEGLAALCGITKFHLARVFKHYTRETIFTYLNALKCKNAQKCLEKGMSVTETATRCGFESVSYFSRTYKRVMGTTPRLEKCSTQKKEDQNV